MPIHEGSVSGFGTWSVPLQGSQVMLFFENSNLSQPRYFASMPGIPESKDQYSNNNRQSSRTDGFKDPKGEYPTRHRLGEPDFHRLSRGRSDETLVATKNQERDLGVPTALGGSWDEPESPYNAQYPHNHVIATHGGITIELDSTPGSTRLNIYHPSNSFIEIDNSGNMVIKNEGEKYEIVAEGKNIHIKQQRNITIDDNSKKRVGANEEIEIGGNKTEEIGGELNITVGGNASITSSGNVNIAASNINLTGPTNINGILTSVGSGGSGGSMTGTFTITSGDIIADGISLKNHTHSDPQGGNVGPPQ